jgi:hypothetical protein
MDIDTHHPDAGRSAFITDPSCVNYARYAVVEGVRISSGGKPLYVMTNGQWLTPQQFRFAYLRGRAEE